MELYKTARNAGIGALALTLGACVTTHGGTTSHYNPAAMLNGTPSKTFSFKNDVYMSKDGYAVLENQLVRDGHANCTFDKEGLEKVPDRDEKSTIVDLLNKGYEWRDVRAPDNPRDVVGSIIVPPQESGTYVSKEAISRYTGNGECQILVRDYDASPLIEDPKRDGKQKKKIFGGAGNTDSGFEQPTNGGRNF